MTNLVLAHGLGILFVLVAVESAGIPLPGETALVAAAFLASQGHYSIVAVIAVAATAAAVGDNIGYWVGRVGGRTLIEKIPIARDHAPKALPKAERYFERHGAKTVFIGRFVAILRFTVAWVAGISHMPWWRFLVWNAAGAAVWATVIGLVAYEFGQTAADAITRYGIYGVIGVAAIVVVGYVGHRVWRHATEV